MFGIESKVVLNAGVGSRVKHLTYKPKNLSLNLRHDGSMHMCSQHSYSNMAGEVTRPELLDSQRSASLVYITESIRDSYPKQGRR